VALSRPRLEDAAAWVERASELERIVEVGLEHGTASVDTEFHRERTYYPRVALVQIAIGSQVWLVDPLRVDLDPLGRWLASDAIELVFHAAEQDLEILEHVVGARPQRVFDTQVAAGFLGVGRASLGALLERFLGVHISKAERTSDWLARPLAPSQVAYAANDVRYLAQLREVLVAELVERGRLAWAEAEMARLLERRRREVDPERAWLRIRECRGLDGEARRVAALVAAWREREAQRLDVPPRSILSDLAVAAVARARPRSLTELRSVRGVDARMAKERQTALVELVRQAHERRDGVVRLPERTEVLLDPSELPFVLVAQALVHAVALELELDPALLASRDDVELFVARREGPLSESWRYELVGRTIEVVLAGSAGLRVHEGRLQVEGFSGR